jgi:hypothetical protein
MIIPRLRSLDSATTGNSGVLCFNNEAAVRGFLAQPGGGILAGGETARARDLPGRLMVTCRPPIIRDTYRGCGGGGRPGRIIPIARPISIIRDPACIPHGAVSIDADTHRSRAQLN